MPKGVTEPREVLCRACGSRFVTTGIGRRAWYCADEACRQRRVKRDRRIATERERDRDRQRRVIAGHELVRRVITRSRMRGVTRETVRDAMGALLWARDAESMADACRALAVEALALEARLRGWNR